MSSGPIGTTTTSWTAPGRWVQTPPPATADGQAGVPRQGSALADRMPAVVPATRTIIPATPGPTWARSKGKSSKDGIAGRTAAMGGAPARRPPASSARDGFDALGDDAVSDITAMKLMSPSQRGTMLVCRLAGPTRPAHLPKFIRCSCRGSRSRLNQPLGVAGDPGQFVQRSARPAPATPRGAPPGRSAGGRCVGEPVEQRERPFRPPDHQVFPVLFGGLA